MTNDEVNEVRLVKGQGLLSIRDPEGHTVAFIHCGSSGGVDIRIHPGGNMIKGVTVWGKRGKRGHIVNDDKEKIRYTEFNYWHSFYVTYLKDR